MRNKVQHWKDRVTTFFYFKILLIAVVFLLWLTSPTLLTKIVNVRFLKIKLVCPYTSSHYPPSSLSQEKGYGQIVSF